MVWQALGGLLCASFAAASASVSSDPLKLPTKVGTGYYFDNLSDLVALRNLSWWYNWGTEPSESVRRFAPGFAVEYVPMQWANWGIEGLASSPSLETASVLLGFNEPNHRGQANLRPHEAASLWPYLEEAADKFGLRLGSPSAAPCGFECVTPDPFEWWDAFFAACRDCQVDFLAVHIYSCNPDAVRWFLNDCKRYGLPVWVTEFACPIGPGPHAVSQQIFMAAAVDIMDRDLDVERYAWFAPRVDGGWVGESASLLQLQKSELTSLGELYMSQSALPSEIDSLPTADSTVLTWTKHCRSCLVDTELLSKCLLPSAGAAHLKCTYCIYTCGLWPRT